MIHLEYAKSFLGTNYLWGGNNVLQGFDCSGFVQEVLASIGMDPKGRQNSQLLFEHFRLNGKQSSGPVPGALAFYGKNSQDISHIAICLSAYQIIEAGGGSSSTTSRDMAARVGATVRIRPVEHRKDIVAYFIPNYPAWVLGVEP